MTDTASAVYVQPGQVYVATGNVSFMTILGSCVSVCLWSPRRGMGGINHFLLPHAVKHIEKAFKFGTIAIPELARGLNEQGCSNRELVAKLFGGANVHNVCLEERHIGQRNVELARQELAALGIAIAVEDVGGSRGRKITFRSMTGEVWVKLL